ncbi:hypothetical protein ciss_17510, partial [Carboxydothermus islandicus]
LFSSAKDRDGSFFWRIDANIRTVPKIGVWDGGSQNRPWSDKIEGKCGGGKNERGKFIQY